MNDAVFVRAEVLRSFENAAPGHVTLMAAPEGFGKSVLLRELGSEGFAIVDVRPECTFERFVGDLVRQVAPLAHGITRSITSVFARSLERDDGPVTLAAWFSRYLTGATHTIAIDGVDAARDERIATFLRNAIARSTQSVRWIVAGRDAERLRSFVPDGLTATTVGEEQFRLTFPELRRLAVNLAPAHNAGELFAIARKATGSISRAVFLLRCLHFGIRDAADATTSFETLLERAFANLSERERLETMAGILLEDGGRVEEGSLAREISSVASRLRMTAPHLFEAGGERFQAAFRSRLRAETRALLATNRTDLFVRAADALEANGDTVSAIALYCAVDAVDRLLSVVERRGGVGLEGEQMHVLREAIALMPEDVRERHPLVVGLRAVDAANRGHGEEAISLFERALTLSSPGDSEQSIRYWYASRGVTSGDAALVQRTLRPGVDFFRTRPPLRAAMMALLGVSWSMSGDPIRAAAWIGRARIVADAVGDDALCARVYQQAAYVACRAGDLDDASELGTRAVAFAEACGWPHVAAISYSILHHVALVRNDDRVRVYARTLAENASRAGNLGLQYAAVAACYEYEVERCNLPAIAEIRAELAQFDVARSPALFEGGRPVLPSAALELAWEGRFAHAFATVEPLLAAFERDRDASSGAQANTFALAAVYAAAAGQPAEANGALRLLRAARTPDGRADAPMRARIDEALALRLLARESEARLLLRNVLLTLPAERSRLRAYAELVLRIVESGDSIETDGSHAALEEELYANGWGGLARLIRSIVAGSRAIRESFVKRNRAIG